MKRILFLLCALLALAASAQTPPESGDTARGSNLLFILDASGSMWGQMDGTPKIAVAKDVMSSLVDKLPDDAKAGLIAYGHRRKGDCKDIETLVALGPLDRDAMRMQIQGLNAKGKTPITASVKQALEQLRQVEQSASIVLVSDGLESCGGDPCQTVKAAKQAGVDFTLHVVGFDLVGTDTAQLQCMADAGGGRFLTAANADELAGALEQAVQASAALVLSVSGNGEPVKAYTYVYRAGTGDEVEREHTDKDGRARYALPAGEYDIKVRPVSISAPERTLQGVVVTEGETTETAVEFSTGTVELTVTTNGKPLKARTYIQHADGHKEAARDATNSDGIARYTIPVGEYRIKVRPDGISAPDHYIEGVTVTTGGTTTKVLEIASGTVRVTVTTDGHPLKARTYIQHADSHKEAARDATNSDGIARYTIPVGEYRIKVRPDGIKAKDRYIKQVIVNPAETTEVSLDFPGD